MSTPGSPGFDTDMQNVTNVPFQNSRVCLSNALYQEQGAIPNAVAK